MGNTLFDLSDRLVHRDDLFTTKIDDETVMLDEASGCYFGLNPVGTKIWELLEKPISLQDLLSQLTQCYTIGPEQCKQETGTFLNMLNAHHLLKVTRHAS
ncbi:MAG: PqqD family protein [Chlamydiae bacterium]|nr:PqqD family protein [Chlamydiota bacterium]MBI3265580.1 PqqD family protein [Chlamydiota bacterium]